MTIKIKNIGGDVNINDKSYTYVESIHNPNQYPGKLTYFNKDGNLIDVNINPNETILMRDYMSICYTTAIV